MEIKKKDLEMYIGKYRVRYETGCKVENGKPVRLEFMYIPCRKGVEVYRYSDNKLNIYFPSKYFAKSITKQLNENSLDVSVEIFVEGDKEIILQINEWDLDVLAEFIKPKTQGKDIKPQNKRKSRNPNAEKKGTYNLYPFSKKKVVNDDSSV